MGDFPQLFLDGLVEYGMTMTVEIDPDGRRSVQIFPTLGVDQVGTFSSFNNEGLFLFPFLHLGERVPEVFPVPISQLISAVSFGHLNVNSPLESVRNPRRNLEMIRSRAIIRGG